MADAKFELSDWLKRGKHVETIRVAELRWSVNFDRLALTRHALSSPLSYLTSVRAIYYLRNQLQVKKVTPWPYCSLLPRIFSPKTC